MSHILTAGSKQSRAVQRTRNIKIEIILCNMSSLFHEALHIYFRSHQFPQKQVAQFYLHVHNFRVC